MQNPNQTIWNFTSQHLSEEEESALRFGLKHGIANRPDDNEILASAESLWHQIKAKGLCRDGSTFHRQAKNQLRAMAFNLINVEDRRFFKDKRMLETIRNLKERVVLLAPDKGNGVVILEKDDYKGSIEELFADRTKFRILEEDPTNSRLTTLQNFLKALKKRGEISEEELKVMYPDNAKVGRAYGMTKVHKSYERIPPLRPIVDTIGSTHYGVGKFLTRLLNPLTQNEYVLQDSFQAAERIRSEVTEELFEEGYVLVSLDVKSLFTNVPLQKTLDVILKRVYTEKKIQTNLTKRTLKKLVLDTCTKTAFLANGKIFEQVDGVSMGASMGPVLANIIMTELEKEVVDRLVQQGKLKFYSRYVDDTLMMLKPEDVDAVLDEFNRYHPSLQFTVDRFENEVPHFLDLEIHRTGIAIYRKDTHTAQYTNFESFTRWAHKTAWIRSLVHRAKKLCAPSKLKDEMAKIRTFAAYNGFPRWVVKKIIRSLEPTNARRTEEASSQSESDTEPEEPEEVVYLSLPYIGERGETIVKGTVRKLMKLFKKEKKPRVKTFFETRKLSFYVSNKDRTPLLSNSGVVYEYECPGCGEAYVGKTNNTLWNRTGQHGWSQKASAVYKHFSTCEAWSHMMGLLRLGGEDDIDTKEQQINAVRENTKILARQKHHLKLDFMESLLIKEREPGLNKGLKSCKDLALF